MKSFFFALVLCLFSLKVSAQCPIYWADDEAILGDYECVWWTSEEGYCIEKEVKQPLSIFPNPTTDFFEVKNAVGTEGYIFDLQGRLIRKIDVSIIINISDLPCAMYIIRVDSEMKKIIKIN